MQRYHRDSQFPRKVPQCMIPEIGIGYKRQDALLHAVCNAAEVRASFAGECACCTALNGSIAVSALRHSKINGESDENA